MDIRVVNKHHGDTGIYIGRGSVLGNPFTHLDGIPLTHKCATRDEAVELYEQWIKTRIAEKNAAVIDQLSRIYRLAEQGPVKLLCYCSPQKCHGDVIKRIIEDEYAKHNH